MSALLDWFGRLTVYGWLDLTSTLTVVVLAVALIRDYEQLRKRVAALEPDHDEEPAPPTVPLPAQTTRRRHAAPTRRHRDTTPGDAVFGDVYAEADD